MWSRARGRVVATVAVGVVVVVGGACSDHGEPTVDAADPGSPSALVAPASQDPGEADGSVMTRVRDGDVRDVDALAAEIAAGAEGDPEWIAVLARIQALDWLSARYPGEYDLHEIYSETWAADHAIPAEEERLSLGVYFDRPLPSLVSVTSTGELGELTQVEVVVELPEAKVRHLADDTVVSALSGNVGRGLFFVAADGPGGRWRVHSVAELLPPEEPLT